MKSKMMEKRCTTLLVAALACCTLFAAGCGNENDGGSKPENVTLQTPENGKQPSKPDVKGTNGDKTDEPVNVEPTNNKRRSLTRRPLEPEATKRLAEGPQIVTTVFEATGRGAWKNCGVSASGKYFLTSFVKAKSTVDHKEETARGNIEVTEIREFLEVRDQLTVSETDIGLSLQDTLPVEVVAQTVNGIAAVAELFYQGAGSTIAGVASAAKIAIAQIDGTTLRGLLGKIGVGVPAVVEKAIQEHSTEFLNGQFNDIHTKVHSIEGKKYKIVYLQDKEGAPLRVDFTNVDGSQIAEDEWDILKLANVFIDAQVIPDKRVQPGDKWSIDAETIQGLVDPAAAGGNCTGSIDVERKDDLANGDWELKFLPARVSTKSNRGRTVGEVNIKDGNGIGDGKNAYVKSLQIRGTGSFVKAKTSARWAIFECMTRIDFNCEFRAMMTSERAE